MVQQDVAREGAVGVGGRHILQSSRADVDPVHRLAKRLPVLRLEVPRAALARVLAVHVTVVEVVVRRDVRVEEEVVHGDLDDVAVEEMQLVRGHGDEGAP